MHERINHGQECPWFTTGTRMGLEPREVFKLCFIYDYRGLLDSTKDE